ncbi:MAG: hypothetical protein JWM33_1314, partial [Caulobacteraceae bacterium]|nr:hypothetical protein [Caulobacteraceae bacterium]
NFEMRAALPQDQGAWPAFWLLPAPPTGRRDGELDVMEQVANGMSHQAVHYAQNGQPVSTGFDTPMGDLSGFHTYGLLWTASELDWYIDGMEVSSMATPAGLDKPMHLLANLAVGGAWAGSPVPDMPDQQMQIDYIRAYALGADPNAPPPADLHLSGGTSADSLIGGRGADILIGAGGADTLDGGLGDDILNGGKGIDTASYASAQGAVKVNLTVSVAQDTGGAGVDTLIAIENLTGSAYGDTLTGNGAHNLIDGGAGADHIDGGDGADTLIGGAGADLLTGGTGSDAFVFAKVSDSSLVSFDTITDFRNADHIDLSGIDADGLHAGDQAFLFIGAAGFSGHAGELRYQADAAGTHVFGDVDGDGVADLHILLLGNLILYAGELVL